MTNHTPEALISSISGDYFLGNDAELELAKNIVAQLAAVTAQRDELLATMHKIACLGNGDKYGNSDGNIIAQAAIAKCEVKP